MTLKRDTMAEAVARRDGSSSGWSWDACALGAAVLAGLTATALYSSLLFHTLAELFSIVIVGVIFVIAWNCRGNLRNSFLLVLGVGYLFVATVDLLHTLAYKGMGVFSGFDANLPTRVHAGCSGWRCVWAMIAIATLPGARWIS
jgi:hypothetical protein